MDVISQMNRKIIAMKLEFLREQRDLVFKTVDDYVSKIADIAKTWEDGKQHNQSAQVHVSQLIGNAINCLSRKCCEIKDESDTVILQMPPKALQDSPQETEPSHLLSASSAATSPVLADSHHPADAFFMEPLIIRCKRIEKITDTLQMSMQQLETVQDALSLQIASVLGQDINVDKEIDNLKCEQTTLKSEYSSQLKTINALFDEEIDRTNKQEMKIQNLEKQLYILSSKMNELEEGNMSIKKTYDEAKENVEMLSVHLQMTKTQTESLNSTLEDTSLTLWNLSTKTGAVEELAHDLSDKVNSNKDALQEISTSQKQCAETVKKLEQLSLETSNRKDLEVMGKRVKKLDANYKMLCTLLSQRLRPLEQLRDCLNKKVIEQGYHN